MIGREDSTIIRFPRRKRSRKWVPFESPHDSAVRILGTALSEIEAGKYVYALQLIEISRNQVRTAIRMMGQVPPD